MVCTATAAAAGAAEEYCHVRPIAGGAADCSVPMVILQVLPMAVAAAAKEGRERAAATRRAGRLALV